MKEDSNYYAYIATSRHVCFQKVLPPGPGRPRSEDNTKAQLCPQACSETKQVSPAEWRRSGSSSCIQGCPGPAWGYVRMLQKQKRQSFSHFPRCQSQPPQVSLKFHRELWLTDHDCQRTHKEQCPGTLGGLRREPWRQEPHTEEPDSTCRKEATLTSVSPTKVSPWGLLSPPCLPQPCVASRITRIQRSGKADWLALPEMSSSAVLIHCSDRSLINTLQQGTASDLQHLIRLLLQPWREGQEGTSTLVLQMNVALRSVGNTSKITRRLCGLEKNHTQVFRHYGSGLILL